MQSGDKGHSEESTAEDCQSRNTIESGEVTGVGSRTGLSSLNDQLLHLSVSPPRQRQVDSTNWRSSTPPPIPPPGRPSANLVRTFSSPSLMDTSPKLSPSSSHRKMIQSSNESSPASSLRHPRLNHELTPVTRNTSDGFLCEERDGFVVVSPEDTLHGEHLALPTKENFSDPLCSTLRSRAGPPLPPLPIGSRTKSLSYAVTPDDKENEEDLVGAPFELPTRKFYSFNSRHQYSQAVGPASQDDGDHQGLTPYQPSRHDLVDVGSLPREELSRIFIPRSTNGNSSSSESSLNPLPLEERQWSIPSIRMATHLNGSTTSYTDEEDELRAYDDDASWSSRGSSLFIPEELSSEHQESSVLKIGPMKPVVIEGDFERDRDGATSSSDSAGAVYTQKRKGVKERRVYEWLKTVDAGDDVIAEAASSKFLTGGAKDRKFQRQQSSPSTLAVEIPLPLAKQL